MGKRRKSKLTKTIEYWTRQTRRSIVLLVGIFILIVVIIALVWIIPIFINSVLGAL